MFNRAQTAYGSGPSVAISYPGKSVFIRNSFLYFPRHPPGGF
jgi:hypothetical protein